MPHSVSQEKEEEIEEAKKKAQYHAPLTADLLHMTALAAPVVCEEAKGVVRLAEDRREGLALGQAYGACQEDMLMATDCVAEAAAAPVRKQRMSKKSLDRCGLRLMAQVIRDPLGLRGLGA